jgi:hypothetical protein
MGLTLIILCTLLINFQQVDSSKVRIETATRNFPKDPDANDSTRNKRTDTVIDNTSEICNYRLKVGRAMEEQGRLTDAYEIYKDVFDNCTDTTQVRQAYLAIKQLHSFRTQALSHVRTIITTVLTVLISVPTSLVIGILLWRRFIRRPLKRNSPEILINPIKVSPSGGDTYDYLSAHIEWYFYRRNRQRQLKQQVSGIEDNTANLW